MNFYIDELGKLIYEYCSQRSEIIGVELDGEDLFFKVKLIW